MMIRSLFRRSWLRLDLSIGLGSDHYHRRTSPIDIEIDDWIEGPYEPIYTEWD